MNILLHDRIQDFVENILGKCPAAFPQGDALDIVGLASQVEERHMYCDGFDREKVIGVLMAAGQAHTLAKQQAEVNQKASKVSVNLRRVARLVAQNQDIRMEVVRTLQPIRLDEKAVEGKRQAACYIAGLLLVANGIEPSAMLIDAGMRLEPALEE